MNLAPRSPRSTPLKVLTIFGTRPEAVKMAPVVRELAHTLEIEPKVCVTAQHREMLDQVLELFDITPDIDLNLMRPGQSLAGLTARVFTHLEPVLTDFQPDWVLVQGDTTTVMAAALLSYYHQIKVGHVEAGLRTGDKFQPFPEEINRRVAGVVADLHFAPTEWARGNLLRENVPDEQIIVTGNTVIDALHWVTKQPAPPLPIPPAPRLVLVTAHRRENHGQPLENICEAVKTLAEHYGGEVRFVYPVHLNPKVQEPAQRILGGQPNITLLPPLDYLPLVHLMKQASIVLTDSGGIQEEAPGLGVPTLVLRNTTERPEGVEAGTLKLVGTEPDVIVSEARRLLDDPAAHAAMSGAKNPYGDGRAAERIVQAILDF
ncbi:MAG TPA: UDP-N-acetylglucosamine 2-epimerase (non-hydrolyzing) [Anaerolineales bacterium]|nr:UDP-N-acetylglucosamine 2-epimerase (non-hydrolyzing) [Anaerolineales bacterium]